MKLAFACPYYGPTFPLVSDSQRANIINATEAGHTWIDDYSVSNTQHRNACEAMSFKAAKDKRVDAVFWTEHDICLPPLAVQQLCQTLDRFPEADVVTGIAFRRSIPYNPMVARLDYSLTTEQYEQMKVSPDYNARRAAKLMSYEEMKNKMLMSISTIDTSVAPFPVDTSSMCALLFRREIFEKTLDVPDLWAVDPMGFFSIDNAFFMRLKDLGFRLYCDPRVLCGHLNEPEIIDWETWAKHSTKLMKAFDQKHQDNLRKDGNTARIYGELTRLADKHMTDKGTTDHSPESGWMGWIHNYCDFYQAMLEPIRKTATAVAEIGVWHGASIKMWRDYFPAATVYGIDRDLSLVEGETGDRTQLLSLNQEDRGALRTFAEQYGPFDMICDDGGHFMNEQQISLGTLFPYIKPGGWYIVEDCHTSFLHGTEFGLNESGSNATIHILEALAEQRLPTSEYMSPEELQYLHDNVAQCLIYGRKSMTCMIQKKA